MTPEFQRAPFSPGLGWCAAFRIGRTAPAPIPAWVAWWGGLPLTTRMVYEAWVIILLWHGLLRETTPSGHGRRGRSPSEPREPRWAWHATLPGPLWALVPFGLVALGGCGPVPCRSFASRPSGSRSGDAGALALGLQRRDGLVGARGSGGGSWSGLSNMLEVLPTHGCGAPPGLAAKTAGLPRAGVPGPGRAQGGNP